MRALVIYESMFGNTKSVAEAVAEGLRRHLEVSLVEVADAPPLIGDGIDLLVVGGPTHAHGMTTPESRADSARRAGDQLVSRGSGIREWLEALSASPRKVPAAAFDTRIKGPGILWGSAAKAAEKQLRGAGFTMAASPESFLVGGPTGPVFDRVIEGELDRARQWGAELGSKAAKATGELLAV